MPNKNPLWVSATTASVNTQSQTVTVITGPSEPHKERQSVHELALLLNSKHRNSSYKGYTADSNGGGYEGL